MPEVVTYNFVSRQRVALRNIVLPQAALSEPIFQPNLGDLREPETEPLDWPDKPPPHLVNLIINAI